MLVFWVLVDSWHRGVRRGDVQALRLGEEKRCTASSAMAGRASCSVWDSGSQGFGIMIFYWSQSSSEALLNELAAGAAQVVL